MERLKVQVEMSPLMIKNIQGRETDLENLGHWFIQEQGTFIRSLLTSTLGHSLMSGNSEVRSGPTSETVGMSLCMGIRDHCLGREGCRSR